MIDLCRLPLLRSCFPSASLTDPLSSAWSLPLTAMRVQRGGSHNLEPGPLAKRAAGRELAAREQVRHRVQRPANAAAAAAPEPADAFATAASSAAIALAPASRSPTSSSYSAAAPESLAATCTACRLLRLPCSDSPHRPSAGRLGEFRPASRRRFRVSTRTGEQAAPRGFSAAAPEFTASPPRPTPVRRRASESV